MTRGTKRKFYLTHSQSLSIKTSEEAERVTEQNKNKYAEEYGIPRNDPEFDFLFDKHFSEMDGSPQGMPTRTEAEREADRQ